MDIILFIINPVLGFLRSLKNLTLKSSAVTFVLFYALFGFAISFTLTSADSYRIGASFCQSNFSVAQALSFFKEGLVTDLYRPLIYSLLKPFTNNPKILFAVFGVVMGLFALLTLLYFYRLERKKDLHFYIFIICILSILSFFNVNGARFWTAAAVCSYGAISALYFKKKWGYFWIALSPLIHFSYYIVVVGTLVYFILKRFSGGNTTFFFYIAMICFALSFLSRGSLSGEILNVDEVEVGSTSINRKINIYGTAPSSDKVAEIQEQSLYRRANTLYTKTFNLVNKVGIFVILSILYSNRKKMMWSKEGKNWFNFVMFIFALGNLASLFFASGFRFVLFANVLFIFLMFSVYLYNKQLSVRKLVYWLVPINLYTISFTFFNAPRIVTSIFWYLPAPVTIIDGWDFAPIDFIY